METLKPCPFCGGEARVSGDMTRSDNWVICSECYVIYPAKTNRKYSEREAIAAWNTRAERTCNMDNHVSDVVWCSVCKYPMNYPSHPNYCPNCGAKVAD